MIPYTIVTISDTHNKHKQLDIPYGDILIHAGDFSSRGYKHEIEDFIKWYSKKPHEHKILIAGNHDINTDYNKNPEMAKQFIKDCEKAGIILLNDSSCEIDTLMGETIKIFGSPIQPEFGFGWAYNRRRGVQIKEHWDKIPKDTDILVTHGPPYNILDRCIYGGHNAGCTELSNAIARIKPKMHIFGHIHEDRGVEVIDGTTYVNSSSLTLKYIPYIEKQYCFNWDKVKNGQSSGRDY